MPQSIEDFLGGFQELLASGGFQLAKTWNSPANATTGINFYDLELGAKMLVPVITPLRNRIPRTSGKGGIQANWRAVTGINTANLSAGVGFGIRGGVVTNATTDYTAVYKAIGLEDAVVWEADLAAMGFDDVKAIAVQCLLWSLMIREEKMILGGNTSYALGTPTGLTVTNASGGTVPTETFSVYVVALTRDGYELAVANSAVPGQVSRTNADGSTSTYGGGSSHPSANGTVSVTTGAAACTVNAVPGACGYAWFGGTTGNEKLAAITTINSYVFTATPTGQAFSAIPGGTTTDFSTNALEYDGLLTMMANSAYNGLWATQPTGTAGTGTPLTADGEGGVQEIDTDLKYFWDTWRLSPTDIYVSSQEMLNIAKKVLTGSQNSAQRFVFDVSQGMLAGGYMVRSYLNKFSMGGVKEIPIRLHPNMPPGTILYYTDTIPYPTSNVTNVVQVRARRDYHQIDWPIVTRSYPYGVYADEVLQNYFPPAFGVRSNIANG